MLFAVAELLVIRLYISARVNKTLRDTCIWFKMGLEMTALKFYDQTTEKLMSRLITYIAYEIK